MLTVLNVPINISSSSHVGSQGGGEYVVLNKWPSCYLLAIAQAALLTGQPLSIVLIHSLLPTVLVRTLKFASYQQYFLSKARHEAWVCIVPSLIQQSLGSLSYGNQIRKRYKKHPY